MSELIKDYDIMIVISNELPLDVQLGRLTEKLTGKRDGYTSTDWKDDPETLSRVVTHRATGLVVRTVTREELKKEAETQDGYSWYVEYYSSPCQRFDKSSKASLSKSEAHKEMNEAIVKTGMAVRYKKVYKESLS